MSRGVILRKKNPIFNLFKTLNIAENRQKPSEFEEFEEFLVLFFTFQPVQHVQIFTGFRVITLLNVSPSSSIKWSKVSSPEGESVEIIENIEFLRLEPRE